eukprot:GHUV01042309.1.p1 GENE.GHUV01042309.1~~GHUV01042309.1.p1  ORF type:complete len:357 (-),score=108.03 GHUV01042309.1:179-1249(-)
MARIEAVWFIEFKFEATSQVQPAVVGQLEQVSGPTAGGTQAAGSVNSAGPAAGGTHAEGSSDSTGTKYAIEQLQSVTVTPPFPPKDVLAEGLICKSPYHVVKALEQQHHQNPEAISKLHMADLLLHPKAGPSSSGKAPPGFRLMVQYVNTISCMRGLPPAKLVAEYSRSDGGVDDSRDVDLSLVMVEYAGPRSVVLRLPSEDYIIKISTDESIGREVAVHRIADLSGNEHLRKMHAVGYGRVAGAGEGLHFIALEHYCQLKISRQHVAERAELLWQQVCNDLEHCWPPSLSQMLMLKLVFHPEHAANIAFLLPVCSHCHHDMVMLCARNIKVIEQQVGWTQQQNVGGLDLPVQHPL